MRIVHILLGRCNPNSANGVEKAVYYLSRQQAALGLDVAILSLTSKDPIPIPGVSVLTSPPPRGKLQSLWPKLPPLLWETLIHWKPDIVHFHSIHIGPFIALGKILNQNRIPYVVTPHGGFAPGRLAHVSPMVHAYIHFFEKPYLEKAGFVHLVSHNDAEGLRALGIHVKSVEASNGIDLIEIPQNIDVGLLYHRFPNLQGKRVYLFLGRLDPVHKGLDLLLHAFAKTRPERSALVLAGPDWHGSLSKLQNLTKKLNLSEQVIYPGPVYGEEKWANIAGANVFVHPSRWEAGVPFSVLEAMAMAKPVLVSRAADPAGVGESGAGFSVDATVDSIAQGLKNFAQVSEQDLQAMGEQALRLIKEKFNWQQTALKLKVAYESIAR